MPHTAQAADSPVIRGRGPMHIAHTAHQGHTTLGTRTGEKAPRGPRHRTHMYTPWCQRTGDYMSLRLHTLGATQQTQQGSSTGGTPKGMSQARPGCIGADGKHQPEPWKRPVTGDPVHSPGGGRLPSSGTPQLKSQG